MFHKNVLIYNISILDWTSEANDVPNDRSKTLG